MQKLPKTYFRDVMQTFGVEDVSSIVPDITLRSEQNAATRKLLRRGELVFASECSYILPDRTRNEEIAKIQRSLDAIAGCNHLTILIESSLQYEHHYFRYKKMVSKEKANSPEDICSEMHPLQEKRATIMVDVKEFNASIDDWSPSDEVNSALRRMPLIDEPLGGYLSQYFDELSSDALMKSPIKIAAECCLRIGYCQTVRRI